MRSHKSNAVESGGVKRRAFFRLGSVATVGSGTAVLMALTANAADAAPPSGAYVPTAEKGAASGVATLDGSTKLPIAQVPDLSLTYGRKDRQSTWTARQDFQGGTVFGSPAVGAMPPGSVRGLVPMTFNDNPGDNIAYSFQSVIFGDWTKDSGVDPGFVWGTNFYTVTGTSPGSANGVAYLYGGLVEANVRAPAGSHVGVVIGLQAEASFSDAASGATVDEIRSLVVAAPVRKDGAIGGVASKAYGAYIQAVGAANVGATEAYSLYVDGGQSKFRGPLQLTPQNAADVGLTIKQAPNSAADAFRVTDTYGNVKSHFDQFGQIAAANNMLAFEGQPGQTVVGRVGPNAGAAKEAGISMGILGDAKLYRRAAGVISTVDQQVIATGAGTTSKRPSASVVGVGASYFDTTLSQPIWSDGVAWQDATGTRV